jgi:hypothetical protein
MYEGTRARGHGARRPQHAESGLTPGERTAANRTLETIMSKNINVNPDHYKVAGRERQGEDVVQREQRKTMAQQQAELERWQSPKPKKPAAAKARARKKSGRRG